MPLRQGRRLAVLLALVALALVVVVSSASAASVSPTTVTGNPSCSDINSAWTGLKVDNVPQDKTYSDGTRSVTVSNVQNQKTFDWSSNFPVVAVLVKASIYTYVYQYNPAVQSDHGMDSPGKYAISHVEWCYGSSDTPPPPCTGDSCGGTPPPCTGDSCGGTPPPCTGDSCNPTTPPTGNGSNPPSGSTPSGSQTAPADGSGSTPGSPDQGSQLVLGERISSPSARLLAPTGCASRAFSAGVRGTSIAKVVFRLDGKVIGTVTKRNRAGVYALRLNPARYRVGIHRLVVTVTFDKSTGTAPRTLRDSFQRCARRLIAPRFTG